MNAFYEAPFSLFLIIVNVLIAVIVMTKDRSLVGRMAFIPSRIKNQGEYYRVITGGFVHAGGAHLALNMITLYFFGPGLEYRLGSVAFLIVYFGAELAAHGLTYYRHHTDDAYSAVGASGSISGVLFGYCLFYPFQTLLLFGIVPIPAWLFAIGFVVFSVYAMREKKEGAGGRIAHDAHLGGAIGGMLLTILLEPSALATFLNQIGL